MNKESCTLVLQLSGFTPAEIAQMKAAVADPEELLNYSGIRLMELGIELTTNKVKCFDHFREEQHLQEALGHMEEKGIGYVTQDQEGFPARLKEIADAPVGLFYRGGLPGDGYPAVSIIGSRKCTVYGREMAHFFGEQLAKRGVTVISGMALGVDGSAMRGALAGSGVTYGVLAGGADICYPMENIGLYTELCKGHGGILSERPPGYHGLPFDFPIRNRIISGLSDAVIVIEAAENSGTFITVRYALQSNREVFALPGRVGDRMSDGCNTLIKNGAQILTCPEDVLQFLGLNVEENTRPKSRISLTPEQAVVNGCLSAEPLTVEQLLEKTQLPPGVLLEILLQLEILGTAKRTSAGYLSLR